MRPEAATSIVVPTADPGTALAAAVVTSVASWTSTTLLTSAVEAHRTPVIMTASTKTAAISWIIRPEAAVGRMNGCNNSGSDPLQQSNDWRAALLLLPLPTYWLAVEARRGSTPLAKATRLPSVRSLVNNSKLVSRKRRQPVRRGVRQYERIACTIVIQPEAAIPTDNDLTCRKI
jgi:hypothetical protein